MQTRKITRSTTSTAPTPKRQRSTLPTLPPAAARTGNPHRLTLPTLPTATAGASLNVRGARQTPPQAPPETVAVQAGADQRPALQAAALPVAPGFARSRSAAQGAASRFARASAPPVLATGGAGAGACRKRPGPVAPRPPLLWARSCALTALLPPAVRQIIKEELGKRLERHFQAPQWNYPIWLFRDSEILWGQRAQMLHAGRALRGLSLKGPLGRDYGLYWLLLYDAERLARLVVERHPARTIHERVVCILGVLRRIGQIYRELRWRCGEQRALWHVRNALSALHWW